MHGAEVVPDDARILTHCNAGALATAGYGTALGVIRGAVERGKRVAVFADETRPFLQGARLTAWELVRDGIDTTVITDSMAAPLMRDGRIDLVVVGADRIAANGDTANKIGTYTVALARARARRAVLRRRAASRPSISTTPDGARIPIEERDAQGSHARRSTSRLAPEGAKVCNPAFDVTPHALIAGIITERGIARAPYTESLAAIVGRSLASSTLIVTYSSIVQSVNADARHRNLLRRNRRRGGRGDRRRRRGRGDLRSNIVASQVEIHREWGGVVPELASRQHVRDICGVVERALERRRRASGRDRRASP